MRQAVAMTSAVLKAQGGAGCLEDTGLPVMQCDSQILPIGEGTTNALSLNALRAMPKDKKTLASLPATVQHRLPPVRDERAACAVAHADE